VRLSLQYYLRLIRFLVELGGEIIAQAIHEAFRTVAISDLAAMAPCNLNSAGVAIAVTSSGLINQATQHLGYLASARRFQLLIAVDEYLDVAFPIPSAFQIEAEPSPQVSPL
jgi:hypothetical protein